MSKRKVVKKKKPALAITLRRIDHELEVWYKKRRFPYPTWGEQKNFLGKKFNQAGLLGKRDKEFWAAVEALSALQDEVIGFNRMQHEDMWFHEWNLICQVIKWYQLWMK